MLYTAIKFLHILFAIGAVGANATYTVWLVRSRNDARDLAFALNGIRFLDNRIANPFYGLLLLSGLAMVFVAKIPLTTRWIDSALVLWFLIVGVGALGYTPALRKQIAALAAEGPDSAAYKAAARRGTITGSITGVLVLLILLVMVFKPTV